MQATLQTRCNAQGIRPLLPFRTRLQVLNPMVFGTAAYARIGIGGRVTTSTTMSAVIRWFGTMMTLSIHIGSA